MTITGTTFAQAAPPSGLPPGEVLAMTLLDIVIILAVARGVGKLFVRIGQPRVVGEIVAGILLGPTLLGATVYVWNKPFAFLDCTQSLTAPGSPSQPSVTACLFPQQSKSVLAIIGQLALIFFMFLVGTEVDWGRLKGKGRPIAIVSIGVVLVPILVGFVIEPFLYDGKWVGGFGTATQPSQMAFAFMLAAMLSVTAFPVMARILQEKGRIDSAMGAVGVAAAAVVTVLMFLLVAFASGLAAHQGARSHIERLIGTALFIVALLVIRPLLERGVGRRIEATGQLDVPAFAWFMIFAFGCAYVADRIGINVITGAFLAGAVLPARGVIRAALNVRLFELTTVILLPIFLAYSGLNTDFTKLGKAYIGGVILFIVAAVVAKWAGGAFSARLAGMSWQEGNLLGILMNCRGLLVLVVALIALNQGVISPQLQSAGVLMALVTTAMTGPLFDRFDADTVDTAPTVVAD